MKRSMTMTCPKVLIVDNSADQRELYRTALMLLGGLKESEICTVSSGGEALQFLEDCPGVRLVLLDLAMPVLDGLTTAEEIRRNEKLHPDTPPVMLAFLSAYSTSEVDDEIADEAQVERPFLAKDGDVAKISDQVKKWLSRAA